MLWIGISCSRLSLFWENFWRKEHVLGNIIDAFSSKWGYLYKCNFIQRNLSFCQYWGMLGLIWASGLLHIFSKDLIQFKNIDAATFLRSIRPEIIWIFLEIKYPRNLILRACKCIFHIKHSTKVLSNFFSSNNNNDA